MHCIGIVSESDANRCHQIIVHCIASLVRCDTDALYWRIRCKRCNTGPRIPLAMRCDKGPIQCDTYACIASVTSLGVEHLISDLHLTTCKKLDFFLSWDNGLNYADISIYSIFPFWRWNYLCDFFENAIFSTFLCCISQIWVGTRIQIEKQAILLCFLLWVKDKEIEIDQKMQIWINNSFICWYNQWCNRDKTCIWYCIVSSLIEPDTGISISLVGEKIHRLGFGFTNEKKKKCLRFFFLQYGQISCVSKTFLVGSDLWDNTEYMSHFPKTIHVYCLRKVRQHKSDIFGYSNF
jgi:hypothetical protein